MVSGHPPAAAPKWRRLAGQHGKQSSFLTPSTYIEVSLVCVSVSTPLCWPPELETCPLRVWPGR